MDKWLKGPTGTDGIFVVLVVVVPAADGESLYPGVVVALGRRPEPALAKTAQTCLLEVRVHQVEFVLRGQEPVRETVDGQVLAEGGGIVSVTLGGDDGIGVGLARPYRGICLYVDVFSIGPLDARALVARGGLKIAPTVRIAALVVEDDSPASPSLPTAATQRAVRPPFHIPEGVPAAPEST